jgi:lambda repressor-like predicted transcriptional regulator
MQGLRAATRARRRGHVSAGLDPAPLLAHLAVRSLAELDKATCSGVPAGVAEMRAMATVAGVSRRTLYRWRSGARVSERHADRCAVALGLHPLLIWPDFHA